jgi:hypothetical protein
MMSRVFRAMLAALALGTVFAAPANAASDEDFVVGTGAIEIPNPLFPESTLQVDISLDAHSDPSGGSPTGTVLATVPIAGLVVFSGSVTCLAVTGNRAVIGFEDMFSGHVIFDVVDNIATGTPDTIGLVQGGPAGCSLPERPEPDPLVSGNFVVHAPTTPSYRTSSSSGAATARCSSTMCTHSIPVPTFTRSRPVVSGRTRSSCKTTATRLTT